MISINSNIRFAYESYIEGDLCTTKVYMLMDRYGKRAESYFYDFLVIAREDAAINKDERKNGSQWDGSHWDTPQVIAIEQVKDIVMSDEMEDFIKLLKAEPYVEDEE